MAELKTKKTDASVKDFLDAVPDEQKRKDSYTIMEIMENITGESPVMWGEAIVGFGSYRYKGRSGREGEWMRTGFSPRKQALTIYILPGFNKYESLLSRLGKFKTSVGCLYVKRLADVDLSVLKELVRQSYEDIKASPTL